MSFVDPLLNWVLMFNPFISILILSFIMGLISTLAYKFASDQKKIKSLKEESKELQKKIRKVSKEHPEKAMKMNSKLMKLNGPLMKESFKSTIWTLIPALIIITWMSSNLVYLPLSPGQEFNVTAKFNEGVIGEVNLEAIPDNITFISDQTQIINNSIAEWKLKSKQTDEYKLLLDYRNKTYDKKVKITETREYAEPEKIINENGLNSITINNEKVKPLEGIPVLGGLNWLWTYILLSMIITTVLRKLLKVY
jgi:uncharacterized membrane protein (DUF106 family)